MSKKGIRDGIIFTVLGVAALAGAITTFVKLPTTTYPEGTAGYYADLKQRPLLILFGSLLSFIFVVFSIGAFFRFRQARQLASRSM